MAGLAIGILTNVTGVPFDLSESVELLEIYPAVTDGLGPHTVLLNVAAGTVQCPVLVPAIIEVKGARKQGWQVNGKTGQQYWAVCWDKPRPCKELGRMSSVVNCAHDNSTITGG